ncbi:uncharacterized protein LOC102674149 isoform X2 [Apis dorsata]|uniref:uncharacterized protein LOC102674149 isoform X2 n=1 Tax=Apis dorsata TaxID=7462 RepID=UPI0003DF7E80|nr:uncharacterized protein LOC102674149 isoform X2 [Apis dorsata]
MCYVHWYLMLLYLQDGRRFMKVPLWRMLCEFFELMSASLSKNPVIPQASSSRSWISSILRFIRDQVSLFRLPNMPRSRRRHRTRSHSRARSNSGGSLQYEHKRRRIDYESPRSKGTYR